MNMRFHNSIQLPPNVRKRALAVRKTSLSELGAAAADIANFIGENRFCLWLTGPLGAGKTTFVGALFHHLGLSPDIPVLSPTYTVMGDYHLKGAWYAHLDLYRLSPHSSLEDLGILDAHSYKGMFVEWPERCFDDPCISPTHLLELDYGQVEDERMLTFSKVEQINDEE